MKVLALTRYDVDGASSRVRFAQYFPYLRQNGVDLEHSPLFSNAYVASLYKGGRDPLETIRCYGRRLMAMMRADHHDLLWVEKELLPYFPALLELRVLQQTPCVIDIDDAIFHNYDLSSLGVVRHTLGKKLDKLFRQAAAVVAGNSYLADRARQAGARCVTTLPSVIDLTKYPPLGTPDGEASEQRPFRIAWIGSPATAAYIEPLRSPLQGLSRRLHCEFWVIGAQAPDWPGVQTRSIPWHANTEVAHLRQCDAGVMPLRDTPWEQGKCSYKLIQYMACGLPVIASPVGMNLDVVGNDEAVGILARTSIEWETALLRLAAQPEARRSMGLAGRARVESVYCLQNAAPKLADILSLAAGNRASKKEMN